MKRGTIKLIIYSFLGLIIIIFLSVVANTPTGYTKTIARYNCGAFDLALQLDFDRNWLWGDVIRYQIVYSDQEFKNNIIYRNGLSTLKFSDPRGVPPLNSNISVRIFSESGRNLVPVYIPKVDEPLPYGDDNKKFSDAEFIFLANCIQENEFAIYKATENFKRYVPILYLKRTSGFLSDEIPQLGSLSHIDSSLLYTKIEDSFSEMNNDELVSAKKFFIDNTAVYVDFNGDIRYIEDYTAWKKSEDSTGEAESISVGTIFTTNLESTSLLGPLQDISNMKTEDDLTFKEYLKQGQKRFGIDFKL